MAAQEGTVDVLKLLTEAKTHVNIQTEVYTHVHTMNFLWLPTATYHTGLDVIMQVTQCAVHVSANTSHYRLG